MPFALERTGLEEGRIQELLYSAGGLLRTLGWAGPDGQLYQSGTKKFQEVVGFSSHIFKMSPELLKEGLVCLDCSCGKSYLAFVLNYLLRSEEHTSELQSQSNLVCRLLLEKKKTT